MFCWLCARLSSFCIISALIVMVVTDLHTRWTILNTSTTSFHINRLQFLSFWSDVRIPVSPMNRFSEQCRLDHNQNPSSHCLFLQVCHKPLPQHAIKAVDVLALQYLFFPPLALFEIPARESRVVFETKLSAFALSLPTCIYVASLIFLFLLYPRMPRL